MYVISAAIIGQIIDHICCYTCSCVAVAIISRDHMARSLQVLCESFSCRLIACLFRRTHILANPINICRRTRLVICGDQCRSFSSCACLMVREHKTHFLGLSVFPWSVNTPVGWRYVSSLVKLKTHVSLIVLCPPLSVLFE